MGLFDSIGDIFKPITNVVGSVASYAGDLGKGVLGMGQNLTSGIGQGVAGFGGRMGALQDGLTSMITSPVFLIIAGAMVVYVVVQMKK